MLTKNKVLGLQDRARVIDEILVERIETLLPQLMKESGIDMWLTIGREYNEDPIMRTLLPQSSITVRGLSILGFHLQEDGSVDPFVVGVPSGIEHIYRNYYYNITSKEWKGLAMKRPTSTPFEYLNEMILERNPKKIGINVDKEIPVCDGLTKSLYDELMSHLDPKFHDIVCGARDLSFKWLEIKCEREVSLYNGIVKIAHDIIAKAFSTEFIQVGVTTNEEIRYYMMDQAIALGLVNWFDCSVAIFRDGLPGMNNQPLVVEPGDILHCDFGIEYLHLTTDTQHLAYVLKPGETQAPEGLVDALRQANRLQDIVCECIEVGKTGDQVLKEAREIAIAEGITPRIYSHPVGYFGHGAGPTIGNFGNQEKSSHGEFKFSNNTTFALELNAMVDIKEWNNQPLMTCLETNILLRENKVTFLDYRQDKFYLIK